MLDNCRYRSIIWSNFPDIYVRNEGCDWLRKKKEEILISCGSALISRLAVFSLSNLLKSVFLLKNHIPLKYQGTIVAFMMGKGEVYNLFIFVTFIRKTSTNCFFVPGLMNLQSRPKEKWGKWPRPESCCLTFPF